MDTPSKTLATALLIASLPWFSNSALAAPITTSPSAWRDAATGHVENVQWRGRGWRGGGWHGGAGIGLGLAAGAIIGGAIAATRPYGDGYAPGYAYGPGYTYAPGYAYSPGYAYGPGYAPDYDDGGDDSVVAVVPSTGDPAYCAQRFRSYDRASGTYLGYDGLRHPCP